MNAPREVTVVLQIAMDDDALTVNGSAPERVITIHPSVVIDEVDGSAVIHVRVQR